MSEAPSLLIELGTEELPPKSVERLAAALTENICSGLEAAGISVDSGAARAFSTPRRLAAHIPTVATTQAEQRIERRGPPVSAAHDADGNPTRALTGFATSCGVATDALETMETAKGAWYVYRAVQPGRTTAELLPEILREAIKNLPLPRSMRWGDHDVAFVRPVHWLVVLHGADVVATEVLGLTSGRESRGHRFHHPDPVSIEHADSWAGDLRAAWVLVDPAERRQRISDDVQRVATAGTAHFPGELLAQLSNLSEWPVAVAGTFDKAYLKLPPKVLVTTMAEDQNFVPVFDAEGELTAQFVGVANIDSRSPEVVRHGYERVIRPRFADAQFFHDADMQTPLADLQEGLARVTYQQQLGSLWDKSCRVAELVRVIANRVGVDAAQATRAASLAKCDLLTHMVGEFPSLQGTMGRYYAAAQGEAADVAHALEAYYCPRQSGEAIADGGLAQVLAVADRVDTLAGIFAVGIQPTGSKDPFALRRAAQGLARTLIEAGLELDLDGLLREALELIPETALAAGQPSVEHGAQPELHAASRRRELLAQLHAFIAERVRRYYTGQGFTPGQVAAVMAVAPATLPDFDRRLRAVAAFARQPQAAHLAAANKRVGNILRKQSPDGAPGDIDTGLLQTGAEMDLARALQAASAASEQAVRAGDYAAALAHLGQLQAPVDCFFDEVLVMAEDAAVRGNRLALLAALQRRFLAIADVAELEAPAKSTD